MPRLARATSGLLQRACDERGRPPQPYLLGVQAGLRPRIMATRTRVELIDHVFLASLVQGAYAISRRAASAGVQVTETHTRVTLRAHMRGSDILEK